VQQREELLDPFKSGGDARGQGVVDLVRGNDLLDAVQSVLTAIAQRRTRAPRITSYIGG
jgi:hypothetical protein